MHLVQASPGTFVRTDPTANFLSGEHARTLHIRAFPNSPSTTSNVRPPTPFFSCSTRTKIRSTGTSWLCGSLRQDKVVARSSPPGSRRLPQLPFVSCQESLNGKPGNLHFRRCDPGEHRGCDRRHGYPRQPRSLNRTPAAWSC